MLMFDRIHHTAAALVGLVLLGSATAVIAGEVTLQMKGGEFSVKGEIKSFDGTKYVIESKSFGSMSLDAGRFDCVGGDCPKAGVVQAAASPSAAPAAGANLGVATWAGGSAQGTQVMPKLIQAYASSIGANVSRTVGSDPKNLEFKLTDAGGRELGQFNVQRQGVPFGLGGLEKKTVDAVWSARPITPEEQRRGETAGLGNLRAPGSENIYALNAMVVVVAPDNPAVSMSMDNVAKIYAGQIKDWSELGLPAGKINIHAMVSTSGYWGAFEDMILKPRNLTAAADIDRIENATDWSDKVAQDKNAIGITSIGLIRNAKALNMESQCGLITKPSTFVAKTEEYPLTHRLHIYTVGQPKGGLARELLTFAMSPKMQSVLRDANFVDQAPELLDFQSQTSRIAYALNASGPDFDLTLMKTLIADLKPASRLTTTFRFDTANFALDSKAAGDVVRLRNLLEGPEYAGKTVVLAGFADGIGRFDSNLLLAQKRAATVLGALQRAGNRPIQAQLVTKAYSQLAPIACNDTPEARSFNRRVEVWVK
jgi:phosphate transport system substrate-binding protein